jgi:hypothetical protein
MRLVVPTLVLSVIAVAALGCSDEATPLEPAIPLLDAGGGDAAPRRDGGSVQDASASADAGAAQDASTSADAGSVQDASTSADAGSVQDASTSVDAGAPQDAGAADASVRADASSDAGPIGLLDGGAGDTGAPADAGFRDAGAGDASADAGPAYAHTIAIDGVNDFTAAETFGTSTPGYTLYVAWDATYVYFGASGSDVQTNAAATKWWQLYLRTSTSGGSTSGVTYRTQQPTLPFPAQWHLRWKTTNDFTGALSWSGSAWVDPSLSFTGNVFRGSGNDFVEMRVARATLGSPSQIVLTSAFLNEAQGGEATYAGAPSTAFTDGYDRDYAKAYGFNLTQSPVTATTLP